jgi:uncharacterized protein
MSDKITDLAARRAQQRQAKQRGCPICGKPAVAASRPFCSNRCRKIDLDRWRSEAYRVPTNETPDPGEPAPTQSEEE